MNRIKFFVCFCLLLNNTTWAQISSNEFENIPLLVDREEFFRTQAIIQDSVGYLWVGTSEGLVKYDGYDTKAYKHESGDSTSLGHNFVQVLHVDSRGALWVGTNAILNRYDPACDCFIRYNITKNEESSRRIIALTEDKENNLWVGMQQGGLVRYDHYQDLFISYFKDPNANLIKDNITVMLADRDNILWIGTRGSNMKKKSGGLLRFSPEEGIINRFNYDPNNHNSLSNNWVTSLMEDNAGQLWVGTAKNGLNKYNVETENFSRILHDETSPNRFQPPQPKETVEDLNYLVTVLHQDKRGSYWIGTREIGLNQFDSNRKKSRFYVATELNKNYPSAFYEDRQGQLWLGDLENGLFRLDAYSRKFTLFPKFQALQRSVESKVEPRTFWISTLRDGLHKLDMRTGNYKSFQHNVDDDSSIGHNSVRAVYEDNDGTVWIGLGTGGFGGGESGKGGLDRFNRKTETFKHYNIPSNNNPEFSNSIYAIYPDENGFLWMSTGMETILRFDKNREEFKEYNFPNTTSETKMWWSNWQTGEFFGAADFAKKVVYRYDIVKDTFTEFLKGYRASGVLEGEEGWYWMGTWDQGLLHYNPTLNKVNQYTIEDGLPSNNGINFEKDENGNLWISTRKGLVKFDPKSKVFSTDGLPIDYFHTSKIKASDGQLFFGGEKGLYAFYADQVKGNPFAPQVLLSRLLISGEPLDLRKGSSKRLELTHQENNLEFSFKAIHHSDPTKNKFQFKLKPFDKDWSEESTQRNARYTNLKPDEYTLEIRAANVDGYWSEDMEAFSFVITPPWWNTWWARIIGIVTLLIVFRSILKYQREQAIKLEKEKRLKNELAQSKEIEKAYTTLKSTQTQLIHSEKMASLGELTAGIAHEIQNPLNFVNNFSEVNAELAEELEEEIKKGDYEEARAIAGDIKANEQKINHHGKRAEVIVKSMLEHSRYSSGQKEPTDINALCDEYLRLSYHGLRAKDDSFKVSMETHFEPDLPKINVIPQDIGRVLHNLINNAFYATSEKSKTADSTYLPYVTVSTNKKGNSIEISVKDNGKGIPESIKEKIFQPFFTTRPAGQGTGLGLSLSYDIVKAHGGTLEVESKEGAGTQFIIQLPKTL